MTVAAAPDDERTLDDVAAVADTFAQLIRSAVRTKTRFLAAAKDDIEWSAHVLLRVLAIEGPMRSSALAERVESDPSTVSRQVAALVRDGLVERRADAVDGRASLLVPTEKADALLHQQNEIRMQRFNQMLQNWSARDLRRFAALLERFHSDYDKASADWLIDRVVTARSESNEGTTR
ncbi:MAG: hypothetical protein QOG80_2170 [Pseudonocardiales bacterium]|jgi:DNA-binding MarR family transcriptional regulator|nr:hypothetical protein [Pseudonocardiales bacterium]